MATCKKDCLHHPVCRLPFNRSKTQVTFAEVCHHFKNKADFVEVVRCKDCVCFSYYREPSSKVSGQIGGYIKQVKELGEKVIVGTNYLDESRNFYFEAAEIFGVVKEVYCQFSRKRVFVRDQAEQKLKEMRGRNG